MALIECPRSSERSLRGQERCSMPHTPSICARKATEWTSQTCAMSLLQSIQYRVVHASVGQLSLSIWHRDEKKDLSPQATRSFGPEVPKRSKQSLPDPKWTTNPRRVKEELSMSQLLVCLLINYRNFAENLFCQDLLCS